MGSVYVPGRAGEGHPWIGAWGRVPEPISCCSRGTLYFIARSSQERGIAQGGERRGALEAEEQHRKGSQGHKAWVLGTLTSVARCTPRCQDQKARINAEEGRREQVGAVPRTPVARGASSQPSRRGLWGAEASLQSWEFLESSGPAGWPCPWVCLTGPRLRLPPALPDVRFPRTTVTVRLRLLCNGTAAPCREVETKWCLWDLAGPCGLL